MPIFNLNLKEGYILPELNSAYPKDSTVIVGDTATFDVFISSQGTPPEYTYQWYANGEAVAGETEATYKRDTSSDVGKYNIYCEVTNKAGVVASRTATLSIQHILSVTSNISATISAVSVDDGTVVSGVCNSTGLCALTLTDGTWEITATSSSVSASTSVVVDAHKSIKLLANKVPIFTYTGSYEILNDSDTAISATSGNWKIRFLTSGTLKITELNSTEDGIDVFCVGGGGDGGPGGSCGEGDMTDGGGGGGGYTKTSKGVSVKANNSYSIVIGSSGGKSSGFGVSASGGDEGGWTSWGGFAECAGGDGGSGGGATDCYGGTDGGDGEDGSRLNGGSGQGSTTREFGESSGRLYASGGNGYGGKDGAANTGNGGGGEYGGGGSGGSGVVVIRNKR